MAANASAAGAAGNAETAAQGLSQTLGQTRLIFGFEKSAAVSASPAQRAFVDFYVNRAVSSTGKIRIWSDLRLSSVPRSNDPTLASLPGDVASAAATTTLNDLTQSGEFTAGVEYGLNGTDPKRMRAAAIAGVGAATPLAAGRSSFYRRYEAGVRVADPQGSHMLDVTLGQDEAVSGGRLRGLVLRLEMFYSLPAPGSAIYLFGTALISAAQRQNLVDVTGSATSDQYRIGIGIDVLRLVRSMQQQR